MYIINSEGEGGVSLTEDSGPLGELCSSSSVFPLISNRTWCRVINDATPLC